MIISNNQIRSLIAQYTDQGKKEITSPKNEANKGLKEEAYQISVSNDAQAYLTAKKAISVLPDIREDRLANIRKMVQAGTYEVNDEEVAEKMIGRSLVDKLI